MITPRLITLNRYVNVIACLLSFAYCAIILLQSRSDLDFQVYYNAAITFRTGGDIYQVESYTYSPLFAWLIQPLAALPLQQAHIWWLSVQLISLVLLVWLAIRASGSQLARDYWGVVLLGSLFIMPTYLDLLLGQVGLMMSLLTMASYSALSSRARWPGWVLAFASLIKLYPGFLGLAYLHRRQWRVAMASLLGGVVLLLFALLVCGWQPFVAFGQHVFSNTSYPYTAEHNTSLIAFWQRLFTVNPFVVPLLDAPWLAQLLIVISISAVLAICLALKPPTDSLSDALHFSIWMSAMLLINPANGIYNLTLLLFPVLVVLRLFEQRRNRMLLYALAIAIMPLFIQPLSSLIGQAILQRMYGVALIYTPMFYSVLGMFLLLVNRYFTIGAVRNDDLSKQD